MGFIDAKREAHSVHSLAQSWWEAEWDPSPKHFSSLCPPALILSQTPCLATWGPVATQLVSLEIYQPLPSAYSGPLPLSCEEGEHGEEPATC